jgi:hypothetical protein
VLSHWDFVRGGMADFTSPYGASAAFGVGVPIRLCPELPPWSSDGMLRVVPLLVPEVGGGPIVAYRGSGDAKVFFEPYIGLAFRLQLSSGLVP